MHTQKACCCQADQGLFGTVKHFLKVSWVVLKLDVIDVCRASAQAEDAAAAYTDTRRAEVIMKVHEPLALKKYHVNNRENVVYVSGDLADFKIFNVNLPCAVSTSTLQVL